MLIARRSCTNTRRTHKQRTTLRAMLAASWIALAGLSGTVAAQWNPVQVDCTVSSNHCWAGVDSPGSPGPLKYVWIFQTDGTDAIFPQDCTNQDHCGFWCPRYEGPIHATVQVRDANNQWIGSANSWGMCTQQDVILP